ncbi:aromatic ring-hydroxylating dioxygenase subunit alpha [Acetobacter sp.]|uniref:aromatic ring-hydroxylating dioxygenase subunit alpha n=1 Tax=Acetobacter sp. TaxID=440 RepID=UPI0025C2791A|nr:aromatic ring-hydroxylating dioxygenase subunit alpha [Acetobacter sp.]MCH4091511.1 aromatic ring-hydroxylating dioxygenase subunit alpha [Acetobacter sp.]MCI1299489.1 aromatic ring-hydroxylating dioxygenase subunit alpha [Acetobacter sp.]MCI1316921.1 aromatic ring-hydroxylating dioxygenase subunit alpha [Acetobacter sp.]
MAFYPFIESRQAYPRNQWYVAAWSHEIGAAPLMRTIAGERIILFRERSGAVRAVSALCPHRQMPLETAEIVNDQIICPYHGAAFGSDGVCTHLPFQKHVPAGMDLKAFHAVEHAPFIWLWVGEEEAPDLSRLPFARSLQPESGQTLLFGMKTFHVRARSQIVLENLFDQSHISFTHPLSLGQRCAENGPTKPAEIIDEKNHLSFTRLSPAKDTDEALHALFPTLSSQTRIRSRSELFGVALVIAAGSEIIACDEEGEPTSSVGDLVFFHAITPETDYSTHYFAGIMRNFALNDKDISNSYAERNDQVVNEDVRVLEAIEPCLADADAAHEPNFVTDAAAVRVRRRIEALMEKAPSDPVYEPASLLPEQMKYEA